jgi:alpha amylase-like protein
VVKPAIEPAHHPIYAVNNARRLRPWSVVPQAGDVADIAGAPYGAVVLPHYGPSGSVTVVFKQPGVSGRPDILVLERPANLQIINPVLGDMTDPNRPNVARARIAMARARFAGSGDPTDSYTVVQFATSQPHSLRAVRYTIRPGDEPGWFEFGESAFPDARYVHGFPDIASRCQTEAGIRGPSCLFAGLHNGVRPSRFCPLRPRAVDTFERIIYELHIGTFTAEGTFDAAASRLPDLAAIGITTIQLMPVDISSGAPGWTYDQTRTGAVQSETYGGPSGLIRFVECAHELGLEVIIDKQYNHAGPEQDSRAKFIDRMFNRTTLWGAGVSGSEVPHYGQIVKLIGEEIAFWVAHYGIDGIRLDATNRMPWELHTAIASFFRNMENLVAKPLYVVSEYAECEEPVGRRTPTGHQYADQPGRFLMKLLGLSQAPHVVDLPADNGSLLRAMLKAAKRGWWYPDVPPPVPPLRGGERVTTLVWHHDWIGNRFGGERLNHLVPFPLFKAILAWQFLGQWTPFVFMGTERCAETPWFYFTGHRDTDTRNNTSAYYEKVDGEYVLTGGRFHEFAREAKALGLTEPLAFGTDGTLTGIDWNAFRTQRDCIGRFYMDPSNVETFEASKLNWRTSERQEAAERLFAKLASLRTMSAAQDDDPVNVQYKAWGSHERLFMLRRREPGATELVGFFNFSDDTVDIALCDDEIQAVQCGAPYVISLQDGQDENDWPVNGRYKLWLDTNAEAFGGTGGLEHSFFVVVEGRNERFTLKENTALIFARL